MQELVKTASGIPKPANSAEGDEAASGVMRNWLTSKYDDSNLKGYDPLPMHATKNPANLPVPDQKFVNRYEDKMEKVITR